MIRTGSVASSDDLGAAPVKSQTSIQADQYEFPYHYLPVYGTDRIQFTRHWGWAPSYLAATRLIHQWIASITHGTAAWRHLDVGCGDGALIHHLSRAMAESPIEWVGIDYDDRAISWAQLLNGATASFIAGDICDQPAETFDSATLVEVAEHIEPALLDHFVGCVARTLKPGAPLLVTVPHANQVVQRKHFQHFSFASARQIFEPHFEIESIRGFDRKNRFSKWVRRLAVNRKLVLQHPAITRYLISRACTTFDTEVGVSRILMLLRKTAVR
jgi:2-polyprenyl-3-methyl-5-hydroxy-6-metoxy-1,4-benzoquinol methylase